MPTSTRRWPLTAVLIALLAISLGACGDDEDEEGAGTATTAASSRNVSEYCDKTLRIETLQPDIDFESATPEQIAEGIKKFAAEKVKPLAVEIQGVAAPELQPDIAILVAATDRIAQTGDFEAEFEDKPEVKAAEQRVHQYDLQNCGWARQNVTASEYAFQGITANAKVGVVSFELNNTGKEMHELYVIKKKAGVTESFDVLLTLPEEEAISKTEIVAGVDPIAPGASDYGVANLEAGEYLVACFLPVGSTPEAFASEDGPPDAEPHALKGMRAILTVA